jgi:hypothetical protein
MKKIILFILLILSIHCFSADFPEATFNSVNTYNSGINYTPNITPVGATNIYSNTPSYTPRKRVDKYGDDGDPYATPIGDVPFMSIFLFATAYVLYKKDKS